GVRNAGHIGASAGDVVIDTNGRVINKNSIQASQSVELLATKNIENTDTAKILAHKGNIKLNSKKSVEQSGVVGAKQHIKISADRLAQTKTGEIQGGNVRIQVADTVTNRGLISSR
ncbi:hypothetical protein HMPREF1052_2149, partial [Pasteurella bettyae CCUG 2042]